MLTYAYGPYPQIVKLHSCIAEAAISRLEKNLLK